MAKLPSALTDAMCKEARESWERLKDVPNSIANLPEGIEDDPELVRWALRVAFLSGFCEGAIWRHGITQEK